MKNRPSGTRDDSPLPRYFRGVLLLILAVFVPWLSLVAATGREAWQSVLAPFGFGQIAVVHLCACLPLSWFLAAWVGRVSDIKLPICVLVAATLSVASLYFGHWLVGAVNQFNFIQSSLLRVVWCFVLQVFWCLAARYALAVDGTGWWDAEKSDARVGNLLLGSFAAVLLPTIFVQHEVRLWSARINEAVHTRYLYEAWQSTRRLADLGVDTSFKEAGVIGSPISDSTPRELSVWLLQQINELDALVTTDLPLDAPAEQQLQRAADLLALDRFLEAESLLTKLHREIPEAAVLLAAAYERRHQLDQVAEICAAGTEVLKGKTDEPSIRIHKALIERWSQALRKLGKASEAEAKLMTALDEFDDKAYFHFQLGQHYKDGGRIRDALRHLDLAGQNPLYEDVVMEAKADLIRETPACFFLQPSRPSSTR